MRGERNAFGDLAISCVISAIIRGLLANDLAPPNHPNLPTRRCIFGVRLKLIHSFCGRRISFRLIWSGLHVTENATKFLALSADSTGTSGIFHMD
jgi:hypothetical protein